MFGESPHRSLLKERFMEDGEEELLGFEGEEEVAMASL